MDEPQYQFPPRRTNGVIGRVSLGQAGLVVVGIALPWLGIRAGSPLLFAAGAVLGIGLATIGFLRFGGRPVTEWIRPVIGAVWSAATRSGVYRGAVFGPHSLAYRMDLPGDLVNVRMIAAPGLDGGSRIGLCVDEVAGTVTAALLTSGTPIVLEELSEQLSRMADWQAVMESTADTDTAITRWQLLFRSHPDTGVMAQQYYLDRVTDPDALPAAALRELVSQAATVGQTHEVFFAVSFDTRQLAVEVKASGGDDAALGVVVLERLTELARQVTEARIPVHGWLSPEHYAAVIHAAFDPDSLEHYERDSREQDPRTAGPSATERHWRYYHHDGMFSSTVWVHELPRRPVQGGWLGQLLSQPDVRRAITLVVEPLAAERAERNIRGQQLATEGNISARAQHGWLVGARNLKELDAARQLDDEIADGAGLLRFHMFVTVTADSPEALRRAVASVRRRLGRIRCDSRELYGEQDQGFFSAALPLARGLRPMTAMGLHRS